MNGAFRLSSGRIMKMLLWKRTLVLWGIVFGLLGNTLVSPGRAAPSSLLPVVGGADVQQFGDGVVVVHLKGTRLPMPVLQREDPDEVELFFPKLSLPSGTWERPCEDIPLLERIRMEQQERGMALIFETNKPLRLREVKGAAPAHFLEIFLELHPGTKPVTVGAATPPKQVASVPKGDPMYSDKLVTLELREVDLKQVFFMLGKMLQLNVICDPSFPSAPVTLSLKDVPMREAFAYLMRMYDVQYAYMGNSLILGKSGQLARALGKESTRAFRIAYAKPEDVVPLLQGLVRVDKVTVDPRLREIYVTAGEDVLDEVAKTLERIDHPGRQVMIQARIFEVSHGNEDKLQSVISHVYKHWYISYGEGGMGIGYLDSNKPSKYDPERQVMDGVEPEDLAQGALRLLDAGLNALQTEGQGKNIARPSVVTVDGMKATIDLTTSVPYISSYKDDNPVYSTATAGPKMDITPRIGRDGMVNLEMTLSTGTLDFSNGDTPATSTRTVTTNVRVRNGEPFVVGGLFQDVASTQKTAFPVLGNLPLLGEIFRWENKSHKKSEVAMVVIPYILDIPNAPVETNDLFPPTANANHP